MTKFLNLGNWPIYSLKILFCFEFLHPSQQIFSHNEMSLPGLNQYLVGDKVSCSRTKCSAARVSLQVVTP